MISVRIRVKRKREEQRRGDRHSCFLPKSFLVLPMRELSGSSFPLVRLNTSVIFNKCFLSKVNLTGSYLRYLVKNVPWTVPMLILNLLIFQGPTKFFILEFQFTAIILSLNTPYIVCASRFKLKYQQLLSVMQ